MRQRGDGGKEWKTRRTKKSKLLHQHEHLELLRKTEKNENVNLTLRNKNNKNLKIIAQRLKKVLTCCPDLPALRIARISWDLCCSYPSLECRRRGQKFGKRSV